MKSMGHFFHTMDKSANHYIIQNLSQPNKLNAIELRIIRLVVARGAKSQQTIANVMGVDKSTITRCLNHLESCGYLTRTTDPYDRRVKRITATQAAIDLRKELLSLEDHFYEWLGASMTAKEKKLLREILVPMTERADRWFLSTTQMDVDAFFSDYPNKDDVP